MKLISNRLSTVRIILTGFLTVIFIGSFLLSLPISSADGKPVPYIDALFTSTSATCVTGLVTLPTVTAWSIFGQAVILVLIQIGGLGVITVAAGIMVSLKRKFGIYDRILIQDSFSLNSLSGMTVFIKKVLIGTFLIEGAGALIYMSVFIPAYGAKGIWISVFNSVSAFCNAGLDIISKNSLCDYAGDTVINLTTSLLIISGGIGFIVWWDIIGVIKSKSKHRTLTLHSKIVLSVTAVLIVAGAILIFIFEYGNPLTMKSMSLPQKIGASLFQSVTTRTAGFATIAQEDLTNASAVVSLILMFIGGSPVGTAGGIKTATAFVLIASAISVVREKKTVDVFNRQISEKTIKKAIAVFVTSFGIMTFSTLMLSALSDAAFLDVIYEAVSATATVGLSRNLTSTLNTACKAVIIATMYFGRVGPIYFAIALKTKKMSENIIVNPVEEINIG